MIPTMRMMTATGVKKKNHNPKPSPLLPGKRPKIDCSMMKTSKGPTARARHPRPVKRPLCEVLVLVGTIACNDFLLPQNFVPFVSLW
jgi:hypothetical protein